MEEKSGNIFFPSYNADIESFFKKNHPIYFPEEKTRNSEKFHLYPAPQVNAEMMYYYL